MIGSLFQLALLGIVVLTLAALIVSLARRPLVLVYALLGVHGWDLLAGTMPSFPVLGVAVGPSELVNLMAFGAGVLRIRRRLGGSQLALLGAIALVVFGTLRGYSMLGDAAMLGFRAELFYLVPAFFVSTLPRGTGQDVVAAVVRFGGAMAAVALIRWIAVALGLPWTAGFTNTGYAVERVIVAGASLAVAFALVWLVRRVATSGALVLVPLRPFALATILAGVVVMAQHRSVWVSSLVMIGLLFLLLPRRWHIKVAVAGVVVITVSLIELSGIGDAGVLAQSLNQAATNAGTWEWRLARWDAVWSTHAERGWGAILFGSGYGYSWVTREVGVWEASPHNGFLQIAVRLGMAGFVLVFGLYAQALRVLLRDADSAATVAWLWTIGTLVYFLPYAGNPLTGVTLGVALLFRTASRVPVRADSHGVAPWRASATIGRGTPDRS